ncbi:MAG: cupin domain-containing protein [Bryobacteraceae bacterium]
MNVPRTLPEVLAPLPDRHFLSQYLGKQFLYVKGSPGKFAGLLPWSNLNEILEHHDLDVPRLRLVREGKAIPAESFITRRGRSRPRLRAADLTAHVRDGATLILDSIDEIQPPITDLAEQLEQSFRTRVQVNMYAGWRTSRGFDLHWDGHDVLILQIAGRKKWGIYGFTREHPLPGDKDLAKTPPREPVWEGLLEEGDLLYIPRGCWHVAVPLDEPTLHLTVGLHHATGADFMEWFAGRVRSSSIVRQDLPRLGSPEERREHLDRMRAAILESWSPALLDDYFEYRDRRASVRPHFAFPASASRVRLPDVDRGLSVKWMVSQPIVLDETAVRLTGNGREWTFAAAAGPLLQTLERRGACTMDDLCSVSGIPPEVARTLVSELLDAGLVSLAHASEME